jgi:hypothetical protein
MVKKWEKFIKKNTYKEKLNEIIKDILNDDLDKYFLKPIE